MIIENQPQIGTNSLAASNALLRLAENLKKLPEKKVDKTTGEMINKIAELSAELALVKERNKLLEENSGNGYGQVAEPAFKYGKE